MQSPDDLELSHWLRPDEQVRWLGRPARAHIPWLPVVVLGVGLPIGGGILASTQRGGGRGTATFLEFLVLIVIFNVANAVFMVLRARTAAVRNRYVLTTHRAAIFGEPGHLVAEVRVDTAEFRAERGVAAGTGEIDWGEASYEQPEAGWRRVFLRMSPPGYSSDEGKVVFAELSNFEAAYAVAAAVRRNLGARTPDPVGPRMRGEAPVALGALDSRTAGVLNMMALCAGSVARVCIVVLTGWTLLGPAEDFMSSPAAALFVLTFASFFWAIAISVGRGQRAGEALQLTGPRRRRRERNQSGIPLPLKYLPYWAIGAIVAVCVGCWISAVLVFRSSDLPGQPSYNAATHTYSANGHGSIIPLSTAQYDTAVRAQDRLFLSVELTFIVIGVGAAADELLRRRQSPYIHRGR